MISNLRRPPGPQGNRPQDLLLGSLPYRTPHDLNHLLVRSYRQRRPLLYKV